MLLYFSHGCYRNYLCDDELSPAQMNNLGIGWNMSNGQNSSILDIFAKHATQVRGKIQVELAQLQYRAQTGRTRCVFVQTWRIRTRGPGEKKLESDRRHSPKENLKR